MGAIDYFLKIDGIKGESTDNKHKDEIDILSWSWGLSQTGSMHGGGGGGSGKVQIQDIHFTKNVDAASAHLLNACATGDHIKSALVTIRKAGKDQQEYLKLTLTDCLVSSVQTGSSGETPVENISLNFAKYEFEYHPQKIDGTLGGAIKSGWNAKTNTKV
jgi:type VI secretion system secreted protein Hcp